MKKLIIGICLIGLITGCNKEKVEIVGPVQAGQVWVYKEVSSNPYVEPKIYTNIVIDVSMNEELVSYSRNGQMYLEPIDVFMIGGELKK